MKIKVRYWRSGSWFGWLHNQGTKSETLELSLKSRLDLIRLNMKAYV